MQRIDQLNINNGLLIGADNQILIKKSPFFISTCLKPPRFCMGFFKQSSLFERYSCVLACGAVVIPIVLCSFITYSIIPLAYAFAVNF